MTNDSSWRNYSPLKPPKTHKKKNSRATRDLRPRGLPNRHISSALEEVAQTSDEAAMVRQRIERKLHSYRGEIDEKKMASIYGSLLRAGFSADIVRRELRSLTKEDVPEAESDPE